MKLLKSLKISLSVSVLLHAAAILLLIVSFPAEIVTTGGKKPLKAEVDLTKNLDPAKKIISAGIVDKSLVEKAAKRQKQAEIKRKKAIQAEQRKLAKAKNEFKKIKNKSSKAKQEAAQAKKLAKKAELDAKKAKTLAASAKKAAEAAALKKLEEEKRAKTVAADIAKRQAEARKNWLSVEFNRYYSQIRQKVYDNRSLSYAFNEELSCEILITLNEDGSIYDVHIVKPSGNPAYDSLNRTAVYKSAPFKMPKDKELNLKLRKITFVFKPNMSDA